MAELTQRAPLSNFCVFCGIMLHEVSRRNPMPLPGNPQAAVCATCLRRKGTRSISSYVAACVAESKATTIRLEAILGSGPKLSRADKVKLDAAPLTGIQLLRKAPESTWTDADIEMLARDDAAKAQIADPKAPHYAAGSIRADGSLNREHVYATSLGYYKWCRGESRKKGGARTWQALELSPKAVMLNAGPEQSSQLRAAADQTGIKVQQDLAEPACAATYC